MKRNTGFWALGILATTSIFSACTNGNSAPEIAVTASFYPIAEVARAVGGDAVDVQDLTPVGHDAHDTDLTAKQLQRLEESSLVFYFGDDFQAASQKAIESLPLSQRVNLFDSAEKLGTSVSLKRFGAGFTCGTCEPTSPFDPHVWLDPANMVVLTTMVNERMTSLFPDKRDAFATNAQTYIQQLNEVGTLIDSSFTKCESKMLVTTHNSFQYFTYRAKLSSWPLAGHSPDQTVSGKMLQAMAASFQKYKVTTVFEEPALPSDLVRRIAENTNSRVDTLNAVESITDAELTQGSNYISIMKDNISKVAKGLRCT